MHFYRRRRVSPVITIVSLVDILTMVLMFFVYTTTFKTATPTVQIKLPDVKHVNQTSSDAKPALVAIDKAGDVYLDDKPVSVDDLVDVTKKLLGEGRNIAMRADKDAPFGKILTVLGALQAGGAKDVPALTMPESH